MSGFGLEAMTCTLCPRNCGAERTAQSGKGVCRAGTLPRIARAALHMWEEPCISGTRGSGAIFFSGCNLQCAFCQNEAISHGGQGQTVSIERLAEIFRELESQGAHNINLVTATHFVPAVIAALNIYRPKIPIVYNCGGYECVETLRMLEGYVDVYLPDFKYIDSAMAKLLSGAPDYPEVALAAIKEMRRQTGPAVYDEAGMMLRGTQIRHLVLPGLTGDSIRLLTLIADELPDTPVSLMGQYTPCGRALNIRGMDRRVTKKEYARVLAHMEAIGLPGYRQALESATDAFVPAFDHTGV
jgi:putative pyruvate formate lyase activating enzyme